ncbi:SRPBCC family protein [Pseudarthrobacter sulfonivorans]|uniref:SRPBCC family protein n=1 Tax=Pseudarthrobacter sulfonivorans TaxID=121292 RepID=UPI00285C142E|nr:SRPBCC family protein [Pseudarthrobacter sulfonivorans]MDR6417682.1 hypothetical protein [Pseudarthrobacter sulfonivorans]
MSTLYENGMPERRTPADVSRRRPLAAAVVATSLGVAVYILGVRPRLMRWGATPTEAAAPLPGDGLVADARLQFTRAVTIKTPVSRVWPWLVQMGAGRGGLYSYDAFENAIGLGIHSSDRILPEFQQLKVGDIIPLHPDGGVPVRLLEPEAVLGLGGTMNYFTGAISPPGAPAPDKRLDLSWTFILRAVDERTTRLVSRTRFGYTSTALGLALRVLLEPIQLLMERKMLLGIRDRAQRTF